MISEELKTIIDTLNDQGKMAFLEGATEEQINKVRHENSGIESLLCSDAAIKSLCEDIKRRLTGLLAHDCHCIVENASADRLLSVKHHAVDEFLNCDAVVN